jgi:hypothetical protein
MENMEQERKIVLHALCSMCRANLTLVREVNNDGRKEIEENNGKRKQKVVQGIVRILKR